MSEVKNAKLSCTKYCSQAQISLNRYCACLKYRIENILYKSLFSNSDLFKSLLRMHEVMNGKYLVQNTALEFKTPLTYLVQNTVLELRSLQIATAHACSDEWKISCTKHCSRAQNPLDISRSKHYIYIATAHV